MSTTYHGHEERPQWYAGCHVGRITAAAAHVGALLLPALPVLVLPVAVPERAVRYRSTLEPRPSADTQSRDGRVVVTDDAGEGVVPPFACIISSLVVGDRRLMHAHSIYEIVHRPGVKLAICRSEDPTPYHCTTEPPIQTIQNGGP